MPLPPPPPKLPGIAFDETLLGTAGAHTKNINSLAWNLTGARLASASDDKTARVYDVDDAGACRPLVKLDGSV